MKTKTNRTVNDALGVRKEVAEKFRKFVKARKWEIAYSAEQALTAWMRETVRSEGTKGGREK
jgi:hypothetical protein